MRGLLGSWIPDQGSNPAPEVKVLSPNHWTAREFPRFKQIILFYSILLYY